MPSLNSMEVMQHYLERPEVRAELNKQYGEQMTRLGFVAPKCDPNSTTQKIPSWGADESIPNDTVYLLNPESFPMHTIKLTNLSVPPLVDYDKRRLPAARTVLLSSLAVTAGIAFLVGLRAWRGWKQFRDRVTEIVPDSY